jgi:hypothetical protein
MPRIVFGPTCDSVDRLPGELVLPGDLAEGDYVDLAGHGAYSTVTNTRFNGFGELQGAGAGVVDHVVILDGTMSSLEPGQESNAGFLFLLLKRWAHRANRRLLL